MCTLKEKLKESCDWLKMIIFIGGVAGAIGVYITIPSRVNNHEMRISQVEKDLNDIKIETVSKLSELQYDVRLIKEALIKKK